MATMSLGGLCLRTGLTAPLNSGREDRRRNSLAAVSLVASGYVVARVTSPVEEALRRCRTCQKRCSEEEEEEEEKEEEGEGGGVFGFI